MDFERPLIQLQRQIEDLERQSQGQNGGTPRPELAVETRQLRQSHASMLAKLYASLSPWDTVKVARHPGRPQSIDYLNAFVKDFCELHGDRRFGDDRAILTGLGRIGPHKCLIIAHNKGKDTRERLANRFGMAHPEGYRKALHKMKLAEKFGLPVVTFVDTPGAYPGVGAEERGQAQAIAENLMEMARLRTPIVSVVIGEGGSGGALGIGVADRVGMLQHAWYSVISPEGCAAILWKTGAEASKAAVALRLTAAENLRMGTIDEVIEEPVGGAHRDPRATAERVERWITQSLREVKRGKIDALLIKRYDKFRHMGDIAPLSA